MTDRPIFWTIFLILFLYFGLGKQWERERKQLKLERAHQQPTPRPPPRADKDTINRAWRGLYFWIAIWSIPALLIYIYIL